MLLSWNLQNMLETPFSSFISKKLGEILIFGTFLAKIQFCPIFPWKSAFSGRPCLKTSLWRHTSADFQNFGINGKGRPSPILWYHTLILWAWQSQVHEGGGNHPPRKMCYGKYLRKMRVIKGASRSLRGIILQAYSLQRTLMLSKFGLWTCQVSLTPLRL